MVDYASPIEVVDRIKAYNLEPGSESIRREANTLLETYSNITDPVERAKVADALTDSGVLPGLALTEADRLDVLGDGDGVKMEDLNHVLEHPENFSPTTRLAADYVKRNFDAIEESTTSLYDWDIIDKDEFAAYAEDYDKDDVEASPNLTPWNLALEAGSALELSDTLTAETATANLDKLLQGDSPDPQQVFAYLEALSKMGETSVTLHDNAGRPFDARIAMEAIVPGSPKSYLHLYATDESGRERIALRAIAQDGVYTQQRDASGNYVSFMGTQFAREERLTARF